MPHQGHRDAIMVCERTDSPSAKESADDSRDRGTKGRGDCKAWNGENAEAIKHYNDRIAREGLPLARYRSFLKTGR